MDGRKRVSAHASLFGTSALVRHSRCSVIVAHSGDEIIGAGGLISRLQDVTVLHVTDYDQTTTKACISALALANVPSDRVVELGVTDIREPHSLASLSREIEGFLRRFRPEIVLTHPYDGGHPDHDATAFATHAAMRLMQNNGFEPPALFEMALHPSHDGQKRELDFFPGPWRETTTLVLDEKTRNLKRRMFDCVAVQERNLRGTTLSLERFCRSPDYDFSIAPSAGKPAYESFDPEMTGVRWQMLARKALAELFGGDGAGNGLARTPIDFNLRPLSWTEHSIYTHR
jgi:LmbE family N-acetylglucosaminyl deacetylase